MKITIYRNGDGWRWRIKAGNREIMAVGEAYTRRRNAEKAVAKLFGTTEPVHVEVIDGDGEHTSYTLRPQEVVAQ
jgi:uncharacterized protein YegP (UPF0339 family)